MPAALDAPPVVFDAPPSAASTQFFLPYQLTKLEYQKECNTPTVQVGTRGPPRACSGKVWGAVVRRLWNLLSHPKTAPRPTILGNVTLLDLAADAAGKEAVKIAYAIPNNVELTNDLSKVSVFRITWPMDITFPCEGDQAYIVVDETGEGGGAALVYKHAAMFVQGPAAETEGNDMFRETTTGEMLGFSPHAICLLYMFCQVVARASTSAKVLADKRLHFDLVVNTDAGNTTDAQKAYTTLALEFASSVVRAVFPTKAAIVAKKGTAAAAAVAAPRVRTVVLADDDDDEDMEDALASLCNVIRRRGVPSQTVAGLVTMWEDMLGVSAPQAQATVYGVPSGIHSLERALRSMATAVQYYKWSVGVVHQLEGQMMMMCAATHAP